MKITTILLGAVLILTMISVYETHSLYNLVGAVIVDTPEEGTNVPDVPKPSQGPSSAVDVTDDPAKGSEDAVVTIVEFSEFQCPFCGRYYQGAYKDIMKNYVDTGKVRYVFKDFPLGFHQNAQKAAEAAQCAHEQGKFWEYHDILFENQGALAIPDLKGYANKLGLDTDKFGGCLDSGKYAIEVREDQMDGAKAGVSGTPSFSINGEMLVGAQPFEAFRKVIESKLRE